MEKPGRYNFNQIEKKWQDFWDKNKTFKAEMKPEKPKYYVLDMFPYPSGQGLHVGHPEGYTASDIFSRYKRMNGFNVLHPMGWDAFGLPAEQYAVQTGTHPAETTKANVENMRRQIKGLGFSYDWDREVNTTDPNYYKWTQWIFLKFYNSFFDRDQQKARPIEELEVPETVKEAGKDAVREYVDSRRLAYEHEAPVNWCPELGTVLANEEVVNGVSERGGHPVIRKPMRQWMLRITEYAERLLNGLEGLDWSHSIKKLQQDWIGKSIGAEVDFLLDGFDDVISVFTTRPDTLFGATYMVLAPEHPLVDKITSKEHKKAVAEYKQQASKKSDLDRTDLAKEKTGQFTGAYAVNPVNGENIPVWISDYVLLSYGTGAIMAVPAHDSRDFEFAKQFGIKIIQVVKPEDPELAAKAEAEEICFDGEGIAVNSGQFNGKKTPQVKEEIIAWLEKQEQGKRAVNYKLRDWLFSRQRYWGEPFPILHAEDGERIALDESELPLMLPEVEDYKPTPDGAPPLGNAKDWIEVTLPDGRKARRELNTMPQWAGSCWYYLRYLDPKNSEEPVAKDKQKYWLPVDLYIGGAEHAVLHLLYSRFWHNLLYDLGYLDYPEPFQKLVNQGMILGEDGQKMSKSRGNVINPDAVVKDYGADSMRLYEMFMGPLEAAKPWSMSGLEGVHRFLQKFWRVAVNESTGKLCETVSDFKPDEQTERLMHQTIRKVSNDIDNFAFNTAISQMMIFVNHLAKLKFKPLSAVKNAVILLYPFAPHMAEELWQICGGEGDTLAYHSWPEYSEELAKEKEVEIAVQVKGKIKDRIMINPEASEEEMKEAVLSSEKVSKAVEGKQIRKVIAVKGRLVNIIT
ncbi:leucine--tRNA ligase [Sedimentisphaera salicampi]|uniref:Leucine--tRNA ligase n=1 Tax=Sedimentisphaera salicampi TaxID=1941349 RepID=A0A1W6LLD8_9BACT|nr:leucine--tRNA ligase [Sedimentisphaera salicampi]ARN56563.1 Leucine--tRNA ligase [Sedimentisphaera salicampi]